MFDRTGKIAPEVQEKMNNEKTLIDVIISTDYQNELIKIMTEELKISNFISFLEYFILCKLTPEQIKQVAALEETHSIWLNRDSRPC